ncbi:MAG: DUF3793 family protein [Lachnospiraceae bacterium]|nr:DUF3793 family protein [Lachnospiraceae bacterium]
MNPGKNRWEKSLIDFCAPTLAGLKCANLFGMIYNSEEELAHEISRLNHLCNGKGIQIRVMNRRNRRALLLVFRENMLNQVMEQEYVWELLCECGYQRSCLAVTLDTLAGRIETAESFPHEIGIFLGYPYCDVKGFIEHAGEDFIFCGYWKVYANENQSRKRFREFDLCRECYRKSYRSGMGLAQLAVAV